MADQVKNLEDLEDGEIGSDEEEVNEQINEIIEENKEDLKDNFKPTEEQNKKSGKKKKSKRNKSEKNKERKKTPSYSEDNQEDFAGNVEKAIIKAMNKNDNTNDMDDHDNSHDRRKRRKRKNNESRDGFNKKKKKRELSDEVDESEMMFVRGASPVQKTQQIQDDEHSDSYESNSSHDSRDYHTVKRPQRRRKIQKERKNQKNNDRDRRRGAHPMQDPDGVCLYFMQGKCHKGDDCMFSHDALPPRKMELCKFYLMECCAKRDKCLYMHSDFPCKYYHTGLPCIYKNECKFAHGPPLSDSLKNILLKHIESAPKEILGNFPRLNREGAMKMINTTQLKLMHEFSSDNNENQDNTMVQSAFDMNMMSSSNSFDSAQSNNTMHDKQSQKQKIRPSRWQNFDPVDYKQSMNDIGNVLSIKNLTGVLTARQISDLSKMGIENLDQLGQLTVLQLNSIGISLKQITEIQLNTMSIQKLGLIHANEPQTAQTSVIHTPLTSCSMDLDLRVPVVTVSKTSISTTILPGQDIDMRFQSSKSISNEDSERHDNQVPRDTIDIDQYTKDALKFASKDKENIEVDQILEADKLVDQNISLEIKDVDHRVLPFTDNSKKPISPDISAKKESDTDIRFLQPDPVFKCPAKRNRRSTTDDDEESNLLIDEKWYSSDDEKNAKNKSPGKSPAKSPQLMSPPSTPAPHVIEHSSVLSRLGDLSKIDISEEVTKLLNTMKNNIHEQKPDSRLEEVKKSPSSDSKSRQSPSESSSKLEVNANKSTAKKPKFSIYECVDGEPTDGRRRADVDLREMPVMRDTDLRQSTSGDIDLRLGLPFKPLPNYTPASEIDGSINSHPAIPYKLVRIDIPRPDYTDIRNSTAKSQALVDPRLRKVFRLSLDECNSDSEKSVKSPVAATPRVDPRRKHNKESENPIQEPKPTLDLQLITQNSEWYKDLSSTQKIFINQQIATITSMIKQFNQDKTQGKPCDLAGIQCNSVFNSIFTNLGVTLGDTGEFSYLPKPKEGLLKTPQFNVNHNAFSNLPGPGAMENSMMNMPQMGMGGVAPMGNMGMGNMGAYNAGFSDPRSAPAPGLLGIAPNMPPNFNYGNMQFNGPGPDFGNMDMENFHRFHHNRGGHRGRGNERWNRGGGPPRGRSRGSWKNDRNN